MTEAPAREPSRNQGSSSIAIRCRGLHKRFGDTHAVRGLDLEVRRGECFGLLGPNGAGKTTTIEILEGIQEADEGEVEILGLNWRDHPRRLRERLGIQLQETELPDTITVEEMVRLFRALYPDGWTVDELVARVRLEEKRRTYARDLSGGQRQRLSLACALAGRPDLLFLDEPTTGLDPQARRHIWDLCTEFRADGGTILLTTHFMDEAQYLCDRLAIMDHGQVLVQGTPAGLVGSLGGEHVVEFSADRELKAEVLAGLPAVTAVSEQGETIRLATAEPHRVVAALFAEMRERGAEVTSLSTHHATLDDVFLSQTGRQLRDE